MKETTEYKLKLIERTFNTNEDEVIERLNDNLIVTYKYYEIALNNKEVEAVNTLEEAEELLNTINNVNEKNLSIIEKYTQNIEEVKTSKIEIAKQEIQEKIEQKTKEEKLQEQIDAMPTIQGIKLACKPISGTISSRYGESSGIRKSTHTGLDIATKSGSPIKVVANGVITFASYNGSYGNLVKVDHGNGVETWYAHTSKMYVSVGQQVTAGETIAAVGTTGNSTRSTFTL